MQYSQETDASLNFVYCVGFFNNFCSVKYAVNILILRWEIFRKVSYITMCPVTCMYVLLQLHFPYHRLNLKAEEHFSIYDLHTMATFVHLF